MSNLQRRTFLTTGAAVAAGGLLASAGSSGATGAGRVQLDSDVRNNWRATGADAANARRVSSEDGFDAPETVAWRYDEGGRVAVADGTVYLATWPEVHALDAEDGSVEWTSEEIGASGTPIVADGTVHVDGDRVTALDAASGEIRWERAFDGAEAFSTEAVADGVVFVVADGTLHALDAADGTVRWERETLEVDMGEWGERTFSFGSVIAANGDLYAVLEGKSPTAIAALDPTTGDARWTAADSDTVPHPYDLSATEDRILVQDALRERTFVLDAASRELLGAVPGVRSVAVAGDVAVATDENGVAATDVSTAAGTDLEPAWTRRSETGFGSPTIVGDAVVVPRSVPGSETPDELVGFALGDGSERWRFAFDDGDWGELRGTGVPAVVDGDTLYVDRPDGLVAVRSTRGDEGGDETAEDDESTDDTGDDESANDAEDDESTEDTEPDGGDGDDGGESDGTGDGGEDGIDGNEGDAADDPANGGDGDGSDDADGTPSDDAGGDENASQDDGDDAGERGDDEPVDGTGDDGSTDEDGDDGADGGDGETGGDDGTSGGARASGGDGSGTEANSEDGDESGEGVSTGTDATTDESPDPDYEGTDDLPGFGVVAGILGTAGGTVLAARRFVSSDEGTRTERRR